MDFISTRPGAEKVSAAEAILKGAAKRGYFVPENIPRLSGDDLGYLCDCDYAERAAFVLKLFFGEFGDDTIENICTSAAGRFERDDPAPLVCLEDDEYILELFHGKSGSQADINATFLIPLIAEAARYSRADIKNVCLVSFGADEGAAVICEAKKSPISHVIAIFDGEKASRIQKKQLAYLVKDGYVAIDTADGLSDNIKEKIYGCGGKKTLVYTGSENPATAIIGAINYVSAYCDVVNSGAVKLGEQVNFALPCGDLCNLLACRYAWQMGVPIRKTICGETANACLGEFFDGDDLYLENAEVTIAPSVDMNDFRSLERLVFEISGRDSKKTSLTFETLENTGRTHYDGIRFLTKDFYFGWAENDDVLDCIAYYYDTCSASTLR